MYKAIVVEDEAMIRRGIILTTDWVTLDCMIAGEVVNGEEGAELVVRLSPDIIATDVKMPRMNGVEIITKLREQGCRAKLIILTTYSDFRYAQSALRLGVSDYLLKPLRNDDLEQAVKHIKEQTEERPAKEKETDAAPVLRSHSDKESKNKCAEVAARYTREHYWENITISIAASFLEISEGYLSWVFKKETDYIFTNYLAYHRMQMAMNLLKDYRVKVYEVADQVGYSDTAYFSAQFKKILGVSPSEYQDRCRQRRELTEVINRKNREKCSTIHREIPMLYLLKMSVPARVEVRIYRFRAFPGFWKSGRQRRGEPITMLGFNDILGREQIKEHFRNAVQTGEVSHVYIPSGEAGMGRKSPVNAFTLSLLCEKGMKEPCTQCHARKQVLPGNHPDPIYVTHKKPASIDVDDIREQIDDAIQVRPYNSYYKIYIMDEAEKMTIQAQNVLPKIIEEPPVYAVTLLLTTNQDAFLSTILSRCVQPKLKLLKDSVVKEYLIQFLGENESKADIYAAFARGNLGKAIHLAQSEESEVIYREMLHLLKHIKDMDTSEFLNYIRKVKEKNLDIRECLGFMQMWYRDILIYKTTKDINPLIFRDKFSVVKSVSATSGYDGLEKILKAIDKAGIRLDANVSTELVMELMFLTMKENQDVSGLQEKENIE